MNLLAKLRRTWLQVRETRKNEADLRETSRTYVDLVDIIFAIIVAESFLRLVDLGTSIPPFPAAVLLLSSVAVVMSWVGYHKSVRAQPHRNWYRFVIDLAILPVYLMLVTFYNDFSLILWTYALMFALYWLWGILKSVEYAGEIRRYIRRIPYFVAAFIVATGYLPLRKLASARDASMGVVVDWSLLAMTLVMVVSYRLEPWKRVHDRRAHRHDVRVKPSDRT